MLSFSRFTIAARITAIALTLAVPLNLIIAAVIWRLSESANEMQRTSLLYTAQSIAAAIDSMLDKHIALAETLARSPALLEDSLEAFEAEARRTFEGRDAQVMVADLEGQQLINTASLPGQFLPFRDPADLAGQRRALETRAVGIGDVRVGAVSQDWILNIEVPIFKNGQAFRALSVTIKTLSFYRLLNAQPMPKGWLACLIDHQGRFIARVPGHERTVGQMAPQGFRKVKDRDGIFEFPSVEGDLIVTANAHSAASGWPIAIAVKKAEMQAAVWEAIRWAAALGGGFSVLSLLLAGIMARSITGPIAELRQKGRVLLAGPATPMPQRGPPEVRDLWQALKQSAADRDSSDQALRRSEERFRGIFENADTGIAILDMDHRFLSCNPAYSKMLGYSEQELQQLGFMAHVHPEDREANAAQCHRLVAQEITSFEIVNRYVRKDGTPIWADKHTSLLRDCEGKPINILTLATDVTERTRQDDQIRLLMREVNHRSKNMLALVQAVARQTLAANPEDFLERFGKRVEALPANQDLLVRNAWKGVDLNELVRSQLGHFEDLIGTRIELKGPTLIISASAAQALGMALHELATNAGKYGALSGANGFVEIDWCVKRDQRNQEIFVMSWRERCAHAITAPSKLGFGSSVISSMAEMNLGAQVELDYPSTGLTWQLSCAAGEVVEGGSIPSIASESRTASSNERTNQRPRVLVVEDEALVAMEIAHALTEGGFDVVGPARNVPAALEILKRHGCDAAVLDINLGRETSEAIAIELSANQTPFVTLSGYTSEQHHLVFDGTPALRKPLRLQFLVAEIKKCIGQKHSGPVDRTRASAE